MRHVVFVFGGMSDKGIGKLEGKTPLEVALHRNMDKLARYGILGTAETVRQKREIRRADAVLSLLGYDPERYGAGRAAFEAEGVGVRLREDDAAYCCSMVSLSESGKIDDAVMLDPGCADISAEETGKLLIAAENAFSGEKIDFYAGRGHRALLILHGAEAGGVQTPPFKVSGKKIGDFMPQGRNSELLSKITEWSLRELGDHFVNRGRRTPVNGFWLWGEGKKVLLPPFGGFFRVKNAVVISDSDLVSGIAKAAGADALRAGDLSEGISGYKKTAESAIKAFSDGADLVVIHLEEPEERSLRGDVLGKVFSIEQADDKIAGPVLRFLETTGEKFSALCVSDLSSSCELRDRISSPVPFALYRSFEHVNEERSFNETDAGKTGVFFKDAQKLMPELLKSPVK